MTITAIQGTHEWEVRAEWMGAQRVVHTGTLFECIAWERANREEQG
jgi:hypothetical protein